VRNMERYLLLLQKEPSQEDQKVRKDF